MFKEKMLLLLLDRFHYFSVDFSVAFDDKLRDGSSFGKLTSLIAHLPSNPMLNISFQFYVYW